MRAILSAGAIALVLAATALTPATARTGSAAEQKKARAAERAQASTAPVVCTKVGCKPLPAHCHAETEFSWEGPTGYQIVVCP